MPKIRRERARTTDTHVGWPIPGGKIIRPQLPPPLPVGQPSYRAMWVAMFRFPPHHFASVYALGAREGAQSVGDDAIRKLFCLTDYFNDYSKWGGKGGGRVGMTPARRMPIALLTIDE